MYLSKVPPSKVEKGVVHPGALRKVRLCLLHRRHLCLRWLHSQFLTLERRRFLTVSE